MTESRRDHVKKWIAERRRINAAAGGPLELVRHGTADEEYRTFGIIDADDDYLVHEFIWGSEDKGEANATSLTDAHAAVPIMSAVIEDLLSLHSPSADGRCRSCRTVACPTMEIIERRLDGRLRLVSAIEVLGEE